MTKGPILKDLKRARRSGKPVRVSREIDGADRLDAYVVGIGRKWVLLHSISDALHLDGYSAVRLRDIKCATSSGWKGSTMTHRALTLRGEHVQPLAGVDLDSTAGLIETLTRAFPLMAVYVEKVDPDVCHIGRAHGITRRKRLRLQEIGPAADWAHACSTSETTADITRIDVGDGYVDALHAVGGDPPKC
ncbi:hypothetical protein [Planobispora longispora]|uniref:Uncharacterized protein n=1 Tax=Planobispora longispora TaxID=28887 RepID=A0A8J3RF80_9ACTN|nr:hypothetical protein [Planobispora longispora]BFE85179.1 hypothetical protein GCM10020093_077800 [Planobispora longispora]GIH75161.1 hypothetical protein Plo01_15900 [Planobispora longispora]